MALKMMEPRSTPSTLAVAGEKNGIASVEPGCVPEAPRAPRSRRSDSQLRTGKNGSSETTHETPNFG